MHKYYLIKEETLKALSSFGFIEESENNQPDFFGSIHTVFENDNQKVRLVWDGKDGIGFAQVLDKDKWVDINIYVAESEESEFVKNIQLLCDAIKATVVQG